MLKTGFGSKGYAKSSIQSVGIRTQAQSYGSVRSAITSIIPYTTNLAVWTTLNPSTISTTTSGSTTVVNSWNDIINNVSVTQASTASMPIPSTQYAIGKNLGIRFVSDDILSNNNLDSTITACMTYGVYMRSNTDVSVNSWIFTAPHVFGNAPNNFNFYALHAYFEGSTLKRYFQAYSYPFSVGNRGFSFQPFTANVNNKYVSNDYIYYFSIGTDSSRNLFTRTYDKNGDTVANASYTYIQVLGVDNTGSWDSVMGGPSNPGLPRMKSFIGRLAADNVYYTQLKFGSSALPTKEELQKITNYLESAYGKVMT